VPFLLLVPFNIYSSLSVVNAMHVHSLDMSYVTLFLLTQLTSACCLITWQVHRTSVYKEPLYIIQGGPEKTAQSSAPTHCNFATAKPRAMWFSSKSTEFTW